MTLEFKLRLIFSVAMKTFNSFKYICLNMLGRHHIETVRNKRRQQKSIHEEKTINYETLRFIFCRKFIKYQELFCFFLVSVTEERLKMVLAPLYDQKCPICPLVSKSSTARLKSL